MKILGLTRLPRKLRDRIFATRRSEVIDPQLLDAIRQMLALQELTQRELLADLRHQQQAEIAALRQTLLDELREQGLLAETAARMPLRATAEAKLRATLVPVASRATGVSVLIPCWNHAGFLHRSIASAIATLDTLPAAGEVVILDDASRDASREVLQDLARQDDRIRLILSEDNLGLPRARNMLLSQAQFEHAMMLDADNELVPSGVAMIYHSARQTGGTLTYGNILRVDESGACLDVISNERISPRILRDNWIDAMSMLRVGRVLELGAYDGQWLYGLEDWELNQRLFLLREPMVFVPVLVGRYSTLPGSMLREAPTALRTRRAARMFGSTATDDSEFRACLHHPDLGVVWSSPGWPDPPRLLHLPATNKSMPLKILVITSGGVLNYGDDAILLSTLQRLARIRPGSQVAVISDGADCPPLGRLALWHGTCDELIAGLDPTEIRRGCNNAEPVIRYLSPLIGQGPPRHDYLKSFDVVLFAGGGNLNSYFTELIARRVAIAGACRAAGVPYVISGQGIGPVAPEIAPMLAFLASEAVAVGTRDPLSARLLRQLAPGAPRIEMVGDDALGLWCGAPSAARWQLANLGISAGQRLLAFHAREADYVGVSREQLLNTARQVDQFAADHGYTVLGVPINLQPTAPETALLSELAFGSPRRAAWHVASPGGDVAAIAGLTKSCDAVVTHSYHVAIFALENQIPTLLVAGSRYYRLKAKALRTAFGMPEVVAIRPGTPAAEIGKRIIAIQKSTWSRGMNGAAIDAWLDLTLPANSIAPSHPQVAPQASTIERRAA